MRSLPPPRSAKRQNARNRAIDWTGGESFDIFSLPACIIGIISTRILSEDASDLLDIMLCSKRAAAKMMGGLRTVKKRSVNAWVCSLKGLIMVTRVGVAETIRNLDIVEAGNVWVPGAMMGQVNAGNLWLEKLTILSMKKGDTQRASLVGCVESLLMIMSESEGTYLDIEVLESVSVTMQLESSAANVQWHNTFVRMGETGIAWEVASDIVKLWSRYSAEQASFSVPRVVNVVSTQLKARGRRHLPPTNSWQKGTTWGCPRRSRLGALVQDTGIDTTNHTHATILDTATLTDDGAIEQVVMGHPAGLSDTGDAVIVRLKGPSRVTTQIRSVLRRGMVWQTGKVFAYELWRAVSTSYTPKAINDHSGAVWCDFFPPIPSLAGAQGDSGNVSGTLEKMPLIYEEVACFMWPNNSVYHHTLYDAFLF